MFLSLFRLCVCVFLCSHWSLVDVPLIFFCPADHVPDWQPRVLLGMVEARSVNVEKTTTTTTTAEIVSRDQILRRERGQRNIPFPCSADHEQDWQPYPVDPYSTLAMTVTIHNDKLNAGGHEEEKTPSGRKTYNKVLSTLVNKRKRQ